MNENNIQNNQTNMETNQTNQEKVQEMRKTVINGKLVPLDQAQSMVEQNEQQTQQTGIQSHHDNSTESVPAGTIKSITSSSTRKSSNHPKCY